MLESKEKSGFWGSNLCRNLIGNTSFNVYFYLNEGIHKKTGNN